MRTPYLPMDLSQNSESQPELVKAVDLPVYERCHFCGTKLVFSHQLNLGFLEVLEVGQCPGCGVSHKPKRFKLQ